MGKKNKYLNKYILFIVFFFTFLGYYASLLVFANFAGFEMSRQITIPIRLLIGVGLVLYIFYNSNNFKIEKEVWFFLLFVFLYSTRILIDSNYDIPYYLSYSNLVFYFLSFCIIPFLALACIKTVSINFKVLFNSFIIGGGIFSVFVLLFYSKFIGEVSRLSSSVVDESVISPLALSYCSALLMGVILFYLFTNKSGFYKKIFLFSIIALSTVPFFLGASRGSLLAIFGSLFVYLISVNRVKLLIQFTVFFILIGLGLVYLDNYFNSGLIDRFLNISEAIETGSSSASRLEIWKISFHQFLENPIIGDKLKVDNWDGYPHNIFIEVLQTTGILGFIPFIILISQAWIKVFYIARNHREYFWVLVIFIQSFIQNMFSGAIYTASWMWTSMALVFSLYYYLNRKKELESLYVLIQHKKASD